MMIRKNRAISPAITTLILLGIAIASGASVFTVVSSTSNISAVKNLILIENANLVKTTMGEEYLSMTLKNAGSKAIVSTTVNLQVDINPNVFGVQVFSTFPSPTSLNPGQTASVYARVNYLNGSAMTIHNVGDTLAIEVIGISSDGSTTRQPTSITVNLS
ncbi:archaellin/type IV pilin N-terminal domain-containing protein [Candidatus Nitrosotenuis sp. DW1]|uniref:archaellin/type IV pilin N-terminal domain-containing protein n=1 Tax=Candidatus Nitrosotenuis sp. DW1 TaxID=2259672 RepID=UPI0015C95A63|nr:archaellin/type IV pilin N-terminal domain-containing protein [Candidatus Nitrosotenuis sp. DW1]QLH09302.1 hypothetical protein DSQ19_07295 [Candidatus Nitrosotenuis sp. DW1]